MRPAMKHRFLAAALLAVLAAPVTAQSPAPTAAAPAPREDLVPVAIDTSLGRIVVALDRGRAPVTAANFLHYVDTHRFDGQNFYRAMHIGEGGLIQGGITTDARTLYPPVAHEPTAQTGLHNIAGVISMANAGPAPPRPISSSSCPTCRVSPPTVRAATPTASPPSAMSSKGWTW
jgi:peptidyl-prolyl cis-trans isomerase A (cyclophilin A)